MVDAIVGLAIERIADLLIHEASFLSGVEADVIRLKDELKRMHCFLKDADSRQLQDERVRNWISDVRAVAYDSEDVIDSVVLKIARKRGGSCQLIPKFTSIFAKLSDLHKVRNQIESSRTRIADISASMQTYGIKFDDERDAHDMQNRLRRTYPHDEEEHVISFDAITRDVKSQLTREDEQLRVVSIVGMGGLGKTTLAKKIYNDIHVRQHFDCYSWTFISQQFSPKDVLIGILTQVASPRDKLNLQEMEKEKLSEMKMKGMKEALEYRSLLDKMKEEELVKTLYEVLGEKRYMVVLDDIWKNEAWDSLKHAFPKGRKGSKVLFTTRNKDVALYADPWSTPLEPPLLSDDEGWELLSKKAFPRNNVAEQGWPPEYETMGREMVRECKGLPLAVAVIGGLLATKKSMKEWKMVQRNINAQFTKLQQDQPYGGVYGILGLSYHDLPFHLKPCFLYLSQFPEDWQIRKRMLIRMWIAEGFIPQTEGDETMEDVAEQYLEELVSRCMVQVSKTDHTGTGVKIFRMHDLVRDICLSKAREESFVEVFDQDHHPGVGNYISSISSQSRRVSIHSHASEHGSVPLLEKGNKLRSLIYYVEVRRYGIYGMELEQSVYAFKRYKLLRVLNIENVSQYCHYIPTEIGSLIHLRYLGLKNTGLRRRRKYFVYEAPAIPASISYLRNLYTLDLRNMGCIIPDVIWKLVSLRHLLLDFKIKGLKRLDTLRNLETLKYVSAQALIRKDAVLQLLNLRDLAVEFRRQEEAEVVLKCPSIVSGRLRSLKMSIWSSFPSLEALSGCRDLTKAVLYGKLSQDVGSQRHSLDFLPASLTKLIMGWSELVQDPMPILEKLHNLRYLRFYHAYNGSEMVCSAGGFRQLESLELSDLEVTEWRIEEGAMPRLKSLELCALSNLRKIPQGLKFVATLKELKLSAMEEEFKRRLQIVEGVEGEDFDSVRHIPSIIFV